jgi:hypothetical protein
VKCSLVNVLVTVLYNECLQGYQLLAQKYRLSQDTAQKFIVPYTARHGLCYVQFFNCIFTRSKLMSYPTTSPKYWEQIRSMGAAKSLQEFHGSECSC